MTSTWQGLGIEATVVEILDDLRSAPEDEHHFGPPFVTAYQLALEFERRRPEVLEALGHQAGGLGRGPDSFARYLARQLSGELRRRGTA